MSGPITWEFAVILIAFAGGVLAIWWRIERRIEKAEAVAAQASETRAQETAALAKDLAAYKLSAAQDFASVMDIKDVEQRLAAAIERLTNRIEQLPRQFAEQMTQIIAAKPRR
jgi:hypothetical protein